ncbi:single-stranded DNA-binding protein, partial [Metamycoplasma alkalescens]
MVEGSFQSSRLTDQNGQLVNSYVISADRIQSLETKEVTEERRKNNLKEFSISEEENKINSPSPILQEPAEDDSEVNYDGLTW